MGTVLLAAWSHQLRLSFFEELFDLCEWQVVNAILLDLDIDVAEHLVRLLLNEEAHKHESLRVRLRYHRVRDVLPVLHRVQFFRDLVEELRLEVLFAGLVQLPCVVHLSFRE